METKKEIVEALFSKINETINRWELDNNVQIDKGELTVCEVAQNKDTPAEKFAIMGNFYLKCQQVVM